MSELGLGRQSLRIGRSSEAELRIEGEGVAEIHAELVHQGQGRLVFVALAPGCSAGPRPIESGELVAYDFHAEFRVAGHLVPLTHPQICAMLMTRGALPPEPNRLVVGRDPERVHLVLASPGVSGKHATLALSEGTVTDHRSTSGTWLAGRRLAPEEPVAVRREDVLAIGPLPLPVELAYSIAASFLEKPVASRRAVTLALEASELAPPPVVPEAARAKHRTLVGTVRMMATGQRTIGRAKESDIVLEHPQISAKHARLLTVGGQLLLEDSGSELGTYVRGARLKPHQHAPVSDGEKIHFGPVPAVLSVHDGTVDVLLEDEASWLGRPLFEVNAHSLVVRVPDRDAPGREKVLLDDVSFRVGPGDFLALMGPSGSGKTTLLHLLTGYRRPTAGAVLVNGTPLEEVFPSLRGSIGYVPQDDILHPELTVFEAVRYSARLRLPRDYSDAELDERVLGTLSALGLDGVKHLTIGRPEAKVLSGGQRKRVNIALEIVTDPPLLFLDEPTSGLAADDTASLVELLAELARTQGKTILATIHQPARDEYERFSHTLVLGHGGTPVFFGPAKGAYRFFEAWRPLSERSGIDNPRDMFAELAEREARFRKVEPTLTRGEARRRVASAFRAEFEGSPEGRAALAQLAEPPRAPSTASADARSIPHGQLALLIERYLKVKSRDRIGTLILLAQAPVIGLLLALVFGGQKASVPYFCLSALEELSRRAASSEGFRQTLGTLAETRDQAAALFFVVVSAIWFGTSNAAREVVSERAIYRRERMVGLSLPSYVLSKFLVLGALCFGQCLVLFAIVFGALGLAGGLAGFASAFSLLFLTSLSAVALGLGLSSIVRSTEAAMALTPIALIPQVVLGGLMVPATTVPSLRLPMLLMPARWGFEGVVRVQRLAEANTPAFRLPLPNVPESLPDYIEGGAFSCALAQLESSRFLGAWAFSSARTPWTAAAVLGGMTVLLLLGTTALIARRDRER